MAAKRSSMDRAWRDLDDAPDLSAPEWKVKFDVAPVKRGRPRAASPKVMTTIRLDADIVSAFRKQGDGWQSRINAALKEWLSNRDRGGSRAKRKRAA
ncbi:MAG TPA: BrnA antitoxin family protein [Roseiarcus sp.]|nr:BrnA antitoxin family protein [Roseiarcus sp.]